MDFKEQYNLIKIVLVGKYGVGKTSIVARYDKNQYNQGPKSTVGVDFVSKHLKVRNRNFKLTIWDTAGQEKYRTLSGIYFKNAQGVIIIYDVTDPSSYKEVKDWLTAAKQNLNGNQFVAMVVGNKNDRSGQKQVEFETVLKDFSQAQNIKCLEVSAKTGQNVNEMFYSLTESICDMLYGKEEKIDAKKVSAVGDIARAKNESKESKEIVDEEMSENKKTIKKLMAQVQEYQIEQKEYELKIQIHSEYIAKLKQLIDSKRH